jgi:hypothetical protein
MIGFIDTLYTAHSYLQVIQRYCWFLHFTLQICTLTRILSLHESYSGNGFITVLLSLQLTHKVFFSQPHSFLAIILQSSTQFNSSDPKLMSWQAGVSKRDSPLYSLLLNWILLYNYFAQTSGKTPSSIAPYSLGVFTAPLRSNDRGADYTENNLYSWGVFTEPLPSSGCTGHNIYIMLE